MVAVASTTERGTDLGAITRMTRTGVPSSTDMPMAVLALPATARAAASTPIAIAIGHSVRCRLRHSVAASVVWAS